MNKRRLLKLADLLEADAKNKKGIKFDLAIWAGPSDAITGNFETEDATVPVDCNTIACAVGLACVSGAFTRSGLGYEIAPAIGEGYRLRPTYDGLTEFRAVEAFFGICRAEADFLFLVDMYPPSKTKGATGERYVAKRIRDFVTGKAKPEPFVSW